MSEFDPTDISEVNRISLQPNEMVVFRLSSEGSWDEETIDGLVDVLEDSPLAGRWLIIEGEVEIDTITPDV